MTHRETALTAVALLYALARKRYAFEAGDIYRSAAEKMAPELLVGATQNDSELFGGDTARGVGSPTIFIKL